jgi:hypothetical protein
MAMSAETSLPDPTPQGERPAGVPAHRQAPDRETLRAALRAAGDDAHERGKQYDIAGWQVERRHGLANSLFASSDLCKMTGNACDNARDSASAFRWWLAETGEVDAAMRNMQAMQRAAASWWRGDAPTDHQRAEHALRVQGEAGGAL